MEKEIILVIGSTGNQGSKVCDALLETGKFTVKGSTRSVPNKKLADKGIEAIEFKYNDPESIKKAIQIANATMLYFVTDHRIAGVEKEVIAGKMIIDACVEAGIKHVVFASVIDCDVCSEKIVFFKSKFHIENHLKSTNLSYSILRPAGFFENFNDSAMYNPLKKGHVKGINSPDFKAEWVACRDTGKAAAVMFQNPTEWNGKILTCYTCKASGIEIASILSEISGTPCKYSTTLPRWMMNIVMSGFRDMVDHFEKVGVTGTNEEFLKVVPDAWGPKEFFTDLGKWHNGEKFGENVESSGSSCSIM